MLKLSIIDDDFNFLNVDVNVPTRLNQSFYFSSFKQPMYFQTKELNFKDGIVVKNNIAFADLVFDDPKFVNWIHSLEKRCKDLMFKYSGEWFLNELDHDDISSCFQKLISSDNTLRSFIKVKDGTLILTVYDKNDNVVDWNCIDNGSRLKCILTLKGIKFNTRKFHIILEIHQILLSPVKLFAKEPIVDVIQESKKQKEAAEMQEAADMQEAAEMQEAIAIAVEMQEADEMLKSNVKVAEMQEANVKVAAEAITKEAAEMQQADAMQEADEIQQSIVKATEMQQTDAMQDVDEIQESNVKAPEMQEESEMQEAITEEAITEEAITEEAITEEAITEEAITEEAITKGAAVETIIYDTTVDVNNDDDDDDDNDLDEEFDEDSENDLEDDLEDDDLENEILEPASENTENLKKDDEDVDEDINIVEKSNEYDDDEEEDDNDLLDDTGEEDDNEEEDDNDLLNFEEIELDRLKPPDESVTIKGVDEIYKPVYEKMKARFVDHKKQSIFNFLKTYGLQDF